jgi:hypothetical protein
LRRWSGVVEKSDTSDSSVPVLHRVVEVWKREAEGEAGAGSAVGTVLDTGPPTVQAEVLGYEAEA